MIRELEASPSNSYMQRISLAKALWMLGFPDTLQWRPASEEAQA